MLLLGLVSLIIGANGVALTAVTTATGDSAAPDSALVAAPVDTPRVRPRPIEISDWYARRLAIHRVVAYATLPVFGMQWVAGNQLWQESRNAPTWSKTLHRVGATSLAGMFAINTVTGAWNWWDSRSAPQGRGLRTMHALSMLVADGAFTYAGARLSNEAETSIDKRRLHRKIALSAMGLTVASSAAMKILNR